MPPKKTPKTHDIRSFLRKTDNPLNSCSTQQNRAPDPPSERTMDPQDNPLNSCSTQQNRAPDPPSERTMDPQTRKQVKKENDDESTSEHHNHHFNVKYKTAVETYRIDCDQPRTVLEVLKDTDKFKEMKMNPENIVIQLGREDCKTIIATHFPCSCIEDKELLTITCEDEPVEQPQKQEPLMVESRDRYSVFSIDTVGGLYTKRKILFRNEAVKKFKYVSVYGVKGMTVKEALQRDGRFIDLNTFKLSDNDSANSLIEHKHKVDNLDRKEFKIRLPRRGTANDENPSTTGASNMSGQKIDQVINQKGISVRMLLEESNSSEGNGGGNSGGNGGSGGNDNTEEIYEELRKQFPGLKELMESRFPDDSYQKTLKLKKENFVKIQRAFNEVHRVRKLLILGQSVCKVIVKDVCEGTGFVLFDNYILTNAHLFKDFIEGNSLKVDIEVIFVFNYEAPVPDTKYFYFELASRNICYSQGDLDYIILELKPEGHKSDLSGPREKVKVPPGLLKKFGEKPRMGEACIIGHPKGEVKQMDPVCIIEKEQREQTINDHLNAYQDSLFIICSITNLIKEQGIENIIMGGNLEDHVTYNTYMYHGSSGSPVFDVRGRVFALHTGGYVYGFPDNTNSVMEFAQPLLNIFDDFLSQVKENGADELFQRIEVEAKGNECLEKVIKKYKDVEESMDCE